MAPPTNMAPRAQNHTCWWYTKVMDACYNSPIHNLKDLNLNSSQFGIIKMTKTHCFSSDQNRFYFLFYFSHKTWSFPLFQIHVSELLDVGSVVRHQGRPCCCCCCCCCGAEVARLFSSITLSVWPFQSLSLVQNEYVLPVHLRWRQRATYQQTLIPAEDSEVRISPYHSQSTPAPQ